MDLSTEIETAEEQLRQAMLASDIGALDRLLSPHLIFTNHLGQCLGKAADLSAHQSGFLRISRLEPSERQIRMIGSDAAVVALRVQLAGTYAGQPAGGDFRFTRVWARTSDNQWQVVAAHAGTVA